MIKYFFREEKDINTSNFCIYINDPLFNIEAGIVIYYKIKTNKITEINLWNKADCFIFKNNYYKFKEVDEFEIAFNNRYTELLSKALDFHKKKYKQETVLHKIVYRYNILNIREFQKRI